MLKTLGEQLREILTIHLELDENAKNVKYEPFIYESPDKGKTVYRRERGKDKRELI